MGFDHVDSILQTSHDMWLCQIGNHKYDFLTWGYTYKIKHNLVTNYPNLLNMVSF